MVSLKNCGLRFFTAGKHIEIIRIKLFSIYKNNIIFHIIDEIKGTVVNRELSSLHGGSLEITAIVRLIEHLLKISFP